MYIFSTHLLVNSCLIYPIWLPLITGYENQLDNSSNFNFRVRNLQFAKNGVKYCEIYLTGTHSTLTSRHTHTHTHTDMHTDLTPATLVALYECIMKTDRTCRSTGCYDSVDSRLRFIYLIFLFFILVFIFRFVVFFVRFSMTLTLSWEICLYIRNVAQKFYCINCCCYIFGTHSGQTDRNCRQ